MNVPNSELVSFIQTSLISAQQFQEFSIALSHSNPKPTLRHNIAVKADYELL